MPDCDWGMRYLWAIGCRLVFAGDLREGKACGGRVPRWYWSKDTCQTQSDAVAHIYVESMLWRYLCYDHPGGVVVLPNKDLQRPRDTI